MTSKQIWAWAFYDFANSPFATTIIAVVFNVYFATVVAADGAFRGESMWAFLVGTSSLVSAILSPFLGALADLRATRKPWLIATAAVGAVCTIGLGVFPPQHYVAISFSFFLASVGFTLSLTFYNSFLNNLSRSDTIGRVSGMGWAVGYIGGGLCLLLNLFMIRHPDWFFIPTGDHWPVRATFISVGMWWLIFTIPFWRCVIEPANGESANTPIGMDCRRAAANVFHTLRSAARLNRNTFTFLFAYILYNDVIETVIVISALFAAVELGMPQGEILACYLMIQFIAFFGALGFGRWSDRWTNKAVLQVTLGIWSAILIWTTTITRSAEFWIAGAAVAIVLGGSQSVSRSLFGKMIPKGSESQFYGFWGVSGKVSAAVGPFLFGIVHEWTGSLRWAIASLVVLLVLGQILLWRVLERDDRRDGGNPAGAGMRCERDVAKAAPEG